MPRIGTTISGLEQLFLNHLAQVEAAAVENAYRISTGKKVNRPADDPAAFFEISQHERRLSVVTDTREQVDAAADVGAQTQLAIDEVRSQLDTIRAALELDENGALTTDERATQQAVIDAALASIDAAAKTEINGRQFLDGSVNYRFSGKDSSQISAIQVYALRETEFSGSVTSAATQATRTYTGTAGAVTSNATITLTGERGSSALTLTAGQTLTDAAAAINQVSHDTGIVAEVSSDDLILTSVDYGADATVDVDVNSGTFATTGTGQGADAVVTINGAQVSSSQVDGNRVNFVSNGTHVAFDFASGFTGAFSTVTIEDDHVAKFRLSPDVADETQLGVPSISTALLGGVSGSLSDLLSGGTLSGLSTNTSQAIRVVDEALGSLTLVEGTVDAFADVTVSSAASLLDGLSTELESNIDQLNEVDEEEESLLLTKHQTLAANTVSSISILQQQQRSMLDLLQQIAGV